MAWNTETQTNLLIHICKILTYTVGNNNGCFFMPDTNLCCLKLLPSPTNINLFLPNRIIKEGTVLEAISCILQRAAKWYDSYTDVLTNKHWKEIVYITLTLGYVKW